MGWSRRREKHGFSGMPEQCDVLWRRCSALTLDRLQPHYTEIDVVINETALEMHYHRSLIELFLETFGLGQTGLFNFYKYSPQKEVFVGFDQAYIRSQLAPDDLFRVLSDRAINHDYQFEDQFFGYFLQFKVVQIMRKRTKYRPRQIVALPHYRVHLDTTKNVNTGFSQHELLFKLSHNSGAFVYYACPMLFDREELYQLNVDLDTLRIADLADCPDEYDDNDHHFVFFNDVNDDPMWCSEPTRGEAASPHEFAAKINEQVLTLSARDSNAALLRILTDLQAVGIKEQPESVHGRFRHDVLDLTYESLNIIRIRRPVEKPMTPSESQAPPNPLRKRLILRHRV